MLAEKLSKEIDDILSKYPPEHKRSAVMPLLYLAQQEYGYVSQQAMREVGELVGMSPTEVGSLVGFYTLYHDEPSGRYQVQVCTDLPCALKGGEELARKLCENLGVKLGEVTPDGLFGVEEVMCLAGCDKAPVMQVQSQEGIDYHEGQTAESAMDLLEALRGKEVQRS